MALISPSWIPGSAIKTQCHFPSKTEGRIVIDGIQVTKRGTPASRPRFTVIPIPHHVKTEERIVIGYIDIIPQVRT